MRRQRTIYFDDARHSYLFNFEPPMRLEDAWVAVDQVAGTTVDTFIYGVARDDGLFYTSDASTTFGSNRDSTASNSEWRAMECIRSLADRGLNLLDVLIDRAHEKNLDFIASLRLGGYGSMDQSLSTRNGGRGWVHEEVRDHFTGIVRELAHDHTTDGVELDFAAPPGGSPYCLLNEDVPQHIATITEWLRRASETIRAAGGTVGVRVYPLERINDEAGLDVRTWLKEGLVDYLSPLVYGHNLLDQDMPIEWLVEAAHEADAAVYPILMPYRNNEQRQYYIREFATPDMMRAAAANYWAKDCDGMYAWFFRWPFTDAERRILSELGDLDAAKVGSKHYVVNRRTNLSDKVGFQRPIPLEIPGADPSKWYSIPFYVADDLEAHGDREQAVTLSMWVHNTVSADKINVRLNDQSLADETCVRSRPPHNFFPYDQWWEYRLRDVRPSKGPNVLEISLEQRPGRLSGGIRIDDLEIKIEYGPYPTTGN